MIRSAALLVADALLVSTPYLGPLLGQRREAEVTTRHRNAITPPDPAFAVWGPIFTMCTAGALASARHRRPSPGVEWWLAGANTANAAWSATVQSGRWRPTPVILGAGVALTAVAHCRLRGLDRPSATERPDPGRLTDTPAGRANQTAQPHTTRLSDTPAGRADQTAQPHTTRLSDTPAGRADRLTAVSTGMLLGWTSVATLINASSVARLGVRGQATTLLAGALALAGAQASRAGSRTGSAALAATSSWALGSLAASPRPGIVRAAATAGLGAVAAGTWCALRS